MSYKSLFFDAVDIGEGVYDRVYSASDFAEYFSRFIGNGVFASPANGLTVESTGGMSLSIKPGYAWINGYLFSVLSGTTEGLTVPVANPTMPRYDSVVLGLSYQNRQITPYIKSGNPAISPAPASLTRSGSLYEIEIARIYVPTGTSYVSQSNIQDTRSDPTRCGFVTGLIDQIDASGLFSQFQAAFNEWFADLQDTLDEDVAANLLERIRNAEESIANLQASSTYMSKIYSTAYVGNAASASKSITFPFSPRRVLITALRSSLILSGGTEYGKDTLEIFSVDGDSYSGIFTQVWGNKSIDGMCQSVSISKTSSNGVTLSWSSESTASACNDRLIYHVTAWGV